METVEVHSKNFLIRWVEVDSPSQITWKVVPLKRSINFGVYARHDRATSTSSFAETTGSLSDRLRASGFEPASGSGLVKLDSKEQHEGTLRVEKKRLLAFVFDNTFSIKISKHVQFSFNLVPSQPPPPQIADPIGVEQAQPTPVPSDVHSAASAAASAALYRRTSDVSSFPPPQVGADGLPVPAAVPASRKLSFSRGKSPDLASKPRRRGTMSSQTGSVNGGGSSAGDDDEARLRPRQNTGSSLADGGEGHVVKSLDGRFVTGFLQKKRRKQYQGFARRYFSLDKEAGLLKYYLNNRSSSLRGVMPVKIAEVRADHNNLQVFLNSGMEKWTLKSNDSATFSVWCNEISEVRSAAAQDEAESEPDSGSHVAANTSPSLAPVTSTGTAVSQFGTSPISARGASNSDRLNGELPSLERLRGFINSLPAGESRNSLEEVYADLVDESRASLAKTSSSAGNRASSSKNAPPSTGTTTGTGRPSRRFRFSGIPSHKLDFQQKLTIFSRKLQSPYFIGLSFIGLLLGALFGFTYGATFVLALVIVAAGCLLPWKLRSAVQQEQFVEAYGTGNENYHFNDKAMQSLYAGVGGSDDDDDAGDFSDASDEEDKAASDAVAYVPQKPNYDQALWQTATSHLHSTGSGAADSPVAGAQTAPSVPSVPVGEKGDVDESTLKSAGEAKEAVAVATGESNVEEHGKSAETSLYPLPHAVVHRRRDIKGPTQAPPSLLSLLKKAKDPSNMTAPITSNEPLSGVESTAEMYENSDLLDAASRAPPKSNLRMNMVAVFAVSRLASQRIKERALRKPFTPLLGETYEMVREDQGFRFIAEKVMHKPEVVATQAESPLWTVHFTSRPHTKMWAKTIQLTDVGHFSITFPDGETVSFMNPELFIRNIIAGERYVEPSGIVELESSIDPQLHSKIEFKAGGMFSGRSEEVKITSGSLVYEGKWTESIHEGTKKIWTAKPLVENSTKHYGWPLFTAQLNQITPIEEGQLPPNDSRLRPDLRIYEGQTDLEKAETLKLELEQHQRERRKEMELAGKSHEPFFFVKTKDSLGHYVLRHGDRNYWVLRQKQDWRSIPNYFQ